MDQAAWSDDERYMLAALSYGRRCMGSTAPNPCVAALVVKDGMVLARGLTAPGGRPHAETEALLDAGDAARGATLYVTLEPCSHHGHTRPCTEAILAAGIARVVIAVGDPDPRVSGRGVALLRQAGVAVTTDICERQAWHQHLGHIRRVVEGRPMVTLKLAETADGFAAAPRGGARLLITGPQANAWVHLQRAMHDAVIVGIGTVRVDDPLLSVRLPGMAARQPTRIVVDSKAQLNPTGRLAASAGEVRLLVLTRADADPARVDALRARAVDVIFIPAEDTGGIDLRAALRVLGSRGLTRVLCEGGPHLGASLLRGGLVDESCLLTSPDPFDGPGLQALDAQGRAALSAASDLRLVEDRQLGRDRLRRYQKDV